MTYDSYMPYPALYRLWMREEVRGLNKSLTNSEVQLLVGLSVSRENTPTHQPRAENMGSGLAGICAGLVGLPQTHRKMEGVAIYAAWEVTPADWQIWEDRIIGSIP
jgi:hypothetical protein